MCKINVGGGGGFLIFTCSQGPAGKNPLQFNRKKNQGFSNKSSKKKKAPSAEIPIKLNAQREKNPERL